MRTSKSLTRTKQIFKCILSKYLVLTKGILMRGRKVVSAH